MPKRKRRTQDLINSSKTYWEAQQQLRSLEQTGEADSNSLGALDSPESSNAQGAVAESPTELRSDDEEPDKPCVPQSARETVTPDAIMLTAEYDLLGDRVMQRRAKDCARQRRARRLLRARLAALPPAAARVLSTWRNRRAAERRKELRNELRNLSRREGTLLDEVTQLSADTIRAWLADASSTCKPMLQGQGVCRFPTQIGLTRNLLMPHPPRTRFRRGCRAL